MKPVLLAMLAVVLLISGCTTSGANYTPMIDFQGKDSPAFENDLLDCRYYAHKTVGPGGGAAAGSVIGALFMAILAPSGYRNDWATSGAVVGAAGGAVGANENQETIIKRCMAGRGYSVLN